jgi:hypothetical protein
MLDVQIFGTGPAGPHQTNVILHAANAMLLFLLLKRLTGTLWPSAFVAAVVAFHPLRVGVGGVGVGTQGRVERAVLHAHIVDVCAVCEKVQSPKPKVCYSLASNIQHRTPAQTVSSCRVQKFR